MEFYSGILSMGYTVDMVRDLIGAETAEHMYIFCVNHGLLKDHSAAYLYDAVCKLLKANEENLESTGFDYEEDSLDSYAAQDHTQSEILTYVTEENGRHAACKRRKGGVVRMAKTQQTLEIEQTLERVCQGKKNLWMQRSNDWVSE